MILGEAMLPQCVGDPVVHICRVFHSAGVKEAMGDEISLIPHFIIFRPEGGFALR